MKKLFLPSIALASILAAGAPVTYAQNVAIVNGKPVPISRVEALSQQIARSGRPVTPEMQGQIRE